MFDKVATTAVTSTHTTTEPQTTKVKVKIGAITQKKRQVQRNKCQQKIIKQAIGCSHKQPHKLLIIAIF